MKRWGVALALVALACVSVWQARSSSPELLRDTDTRVLLAKVAERHDALSWFAGDWPLGNHFYRPISTLVFVADQALYGNQPAGYGATNALLAIAGVLTLFWLVRELTDRASWAVGCSVLFAFWQTGAWALPTLQRFGGWAVLLIPIPVLLRSVPEMKAKLGAAFLAMATLSAGLSELGGIAELRSYTLSWLPGRTATTMTVFALAAMAAYARYERLGASRIAPKASPTDPPATRTTQASGGPARWPLGWALLACAATLLALGSYEQAVALPGALFGVAVFMRMSGYRVRWGWQAAFWSLLFAYLALRHSLVSSEVSHYQAQQFRHGPGVWIAVGDYVLPCAAHLVGALAIMEFGTAALYFAQTWRTLWIAATNVSVALVARRRLATFLFGWALSSLTFLPMAWLKPFGHYSYWPMALRTVLVVTLFALAGDLVVSAWSRPKLQAPLRSDPAPGSLPRR